MERLHSKNQLPRPHPGSPARLIEIDLHSLIGRRRKKPFTLQAKALRALAGFLSLMIFFTVLSRVADSLTIARVDLQETQKRSIDHKITASGQVIANGAKTVTSFPGIRVASLAVKPGEAVAENDPLFSLSLEDLQQKLEETELELEKLNLDIRDQKSREKTEADSRSTALARALQDYNDMKSETGKAVEQAQKILTEAQNRLEEYCTGAVWNFKSRWKYAELPEQDPDGTRHPGRRRSNTSFTGFAGGFRYVPGQSQHTIRNCSTQIFDRICKPPWTFRPMVFPALLERTSPCRNAACPSSSAAVCFVLPFENNFHRPGIPPSFSGLPPALRAVLVSLALALRILFPASRRLYSHQVVRF